VLVDKLKHLLEFPLETVYFASLNNTHTFNKINNITYDQFRVYIIVTCTENEPRTVLLQRACLSQNILQHFTFMSPCIVTNFLIIKPTRRTNFSNLFFNETLHVSSSSSVHHQELFTVRSAMVYVIQVCRQLSSRIWMEYPNPDVQKLSTNLYDIYHC
jgi:hypothetical protein